MRTAGAVVACILVLLLGLAVGRSCPQKPTKAERQADTVLADTAAVRKARESQDSIIAAHNQETQALRRERNRWRDSANALAKDVEKEASAAATLTTVPPGSAHDTITHLTAALEATTKVAARYRSQVVPALERVIYLDSLDILRGDKQLALERSWTVEDQRRIDQLTKALSNLRNERRGGGKFLGFLPSWTDEALIAAGGVYLGTRIGKRS